jgi:flagellar motor protein MotB
MVDMSMDPARLSAQGNAQYNPITPNVDDASRAKNRRVDIVVLYPPDNSSTPSPMALPSL